MDISNLTQLWEEKFDHIYLQHYPKYKERFEPIINELKRVGIYDASNFSIYYSIPTQIDEHIYDFYKDNNRLFSDSFTINFFRCNVTFYRILCESVELGYQKILVIHDDIKFLKDLDKIYDILSNVPDDYDVCLFDYINCYQCQNQSMDNLTKYNEYYYSYDCLLGNTIGAYSYDYMKVIIDCNNYKFGHVDSYISDILLSYQTMMEAGYNIYDYKIIFSYPRIAIQHEYKTSLANQLFNSDFSISDQYQTHMVNFLNKDINYSDYNI